jgi:hypothetical protein
MRSDLVGNQRRRRINRRPGIVEDRRVTAVVEHHKSNPIRDSNLHRHLNPLDRLLGLIHLGPIIEDNPINPRHLSPRKTPVTIGGTSAGIEFLTFYFFLRTSRETSLLLCLDFSVDKSFSVPLLYGIISFFLWSFFRGYHSVTVFISLIICLATIRLTYSGGLRIFSFFLYLAISCFGFFFLRLHFWLEILP